MLRALGRLVIGVVMVVVATVAGWAVFVEYPATLTELIGVILVIGTVGAGLQLANRLGTSVLPDYTVAEVAVKGPIQRDTGGMGVASDPRAPDADEIVEQIERADEDGAVEALLVKLNTPGGEVVPSDDIRNAAREFDGPTIAYTNDLCASGGMWIASGCDQLWARDGSIVGSIGVRFSQLRINEFLDEHGVSYEQIVSGEYKDALSSFKPLEEDEREYLQSLSDAWYEHFVERVAENTDMGVEEVRETEAKVYMGEEAAELGLVDELGDRDDVEDSLADRIEPEVVVESFEPQRGLRAKLTASATGLAYALGAGMTGSLTEQGLQMRHR